MTSEPPSPHSLMQKALSLAQQSPPKPTNYCVGAVLFNPSTNEIISTGYTLELPGNTHAEQCCIQKLAQQHNVPEEKIAEVLPPNVAIYTTMEPCNLRLSGNVTCVDRIIAARNIKRVYLGVKEPEKFVGENEGRKKLEQAGIECVHVPGLEEEILRVATAGHEK
ncbi:cytidine deaminase-like protein [Periconia macrospinosa]|uniref:Cytidine deaminase-like protein n=1 Tax=Periconia macrospinosa TaxID=97972 RepID=A0A2V1E3N6_9PLEO|nr:cytidine deaminase-like protein [Periconia macrospinosa]